MPALDDEIHAEKYFVTDETIDKSVKRKDKEAKLLGEYGKALFTTCSQILCARFLSHNLIAVAESAGRISLVDYPSGNVVKAFKAHKAPITALCVVSANLIVSCSWDKTLKLWNLDRVNAAERTLEGHTDFVKCAAVGMDAHGLKVILASGSADKKIRLWDYATGECINVLEGHTRAVEGVQFAESRLISSSSDRSIRVWDQSSGNCLHVMNGHETSVYGIFYDISEEELFSTSADCYLKLWHENKTVFAWKHPDCIKCVAVARPFIVTGCRDHQIRLWTKDDQKNPIKVIDANVDEVSTLDILDEQLILSGSYDGTLRVWDLKNLFGTKGGKVSEHVPAKVTHKEDIMSPEEEAELAALLEE